MTEEAKIVARECAKLMCLPCSENAPWHPEVPEIAHLYLGIPCKALSLRRRFPEAFEVVK